MKTTLKILGHSFALLFFWIIANMISSSVFNISQPESANPSFVLTLLWVTCLLNASVLHLYLNHTSLSRSRRAVHLFILHFGIQWFLSQMEAWFFIDSQVMSRSLIASLVLGGAIMAFCYSVMTSFTYPEIKRQTQLGLVDKKALILNMLIAAIFIYPVIYFNFGYFIAWQSEELRNYYTGTSQNQGYWSMLHHHIFGSSIYILQVLRSFIWMGLAWIMIEGYSRTQRSAMLTLGCLFAVLMNSSLLLPNAIMPDTVRLYHAIETVTSNFIWGILLVLLFTRKDQKKIPR